MLNETKLSLTQEKSVWEIETGIRSLYLALLLNRVRNNLSNQVKTLLDVGGLATLSVAREVSLQNIAVLSNHEGLKELILRETRQKKPIQFIKGGREVLENLPSKAFDLVIILDTHISSDSDEMETVPFHLSRITRKQLITSISNRFVSIKSFLRSSISQVSKFSQAFYHTLEGEEVSPNLLLKRDHAPQVIDQSYYAGFHALVPGQVEHSFKKAGFSSIALESFGSLIRATPKEVLVKVMEQEDWIETFAQRCEEYENMQQSVGFNPNTAADLVLVAQHEV